MIQEKEYGTSDEEQECFHIWAKIDALKRKEKEKRMTVL